ncbi:MAG: DUF881 domain-containing protein [Clostridiales bacterium]|nr:DUF881 domain-containing protein [Clostridiales bacterium]
MKNWKAAITLGVVCCILTIAISVQIKTVDDSNSTVSQTLTGNELRDQILKWEEKYDKAVHELEKSEVELENIRLEYTKKDENAVLKEEEIKKDNIVLGLTDVKGDGLVITLKDNNNVTRSSIGILDNIELYLVHAGDLIKIVNSLKNAGAEAISINGQRIVNSTSINCAGNVIKINGEKVSSPFEIKAIGSPELLYGSLMIPGGHIEIFKETGLIVDVKKEKDIEIKKYEGIISAQYMRNQ